MKLHKSKAYRNETTAEESSACCGTTATKSNSVADPCCEQPIDGSSCCDKTATQEENSKSTGCC